MEADAPLGGPPGHVVLDPVAGEQAHLAVVHSHGEMDDELSLGEPQEAAEAVLQAQLLSHSVELGQGDLVGGGLLR